MPNIYISVTDNRKQLTIDGSLELLRQLLWAMLTGVSHGSDEPADYDGEHKANAEHIAEVCRVTAV